MFSEFEEKVGNELYENEAISKSFYAENYQMIKKSVDVSVAPAAFVGNKDYSFNYYLIITNQRIFVGEVDVYMKVKKYTVMSLDEVVEASFEKNKTTIGKTSVGIIYYIGGLFPIMAIGTMILKLIIEKMGIVQSDVIQVIWALIIQSSLIYLDYRLIKRIIGSNYRGYIKFKDGKELFPLVDNRSDLSQLIN